MAGRSVLVVGASGVIGAAGVRRFAADPACEVVGVSRRPPVDAPGATFVSVDLFDGARCREVFGGMGGVTHLVYAAVYELPGLVAGWRDEGHRRRNLEMFRNVLDPLVDAGGALRHVTLLQGMKAYGGHLGPAPVPAREREPRHDHPDFYFLQEDHLRDRRRDAGWSFTILRPQVVYGISLGSPMNLIPAIGVYGAVRRAQGLPLSFPGGAPRVSEAVDADLLAHVVDWCGDAASARDETFNVTNGDVFTWRDVWPAIAETLGMPLGPDEPQRLATAMPSLEPVWAEVVRGYGLDAPPELARMVGDAFVYADLLFGYGADEIRMPVLASTLKLRQAGFGACTDTEDMFRRLLRRAQDLRLLPPPSS
jgi:nucleoside-diphosphate-sugar epimerase